MTVLTDEQLADGWIEHDGGPCPVALDSLVQIFHRGGHANKHFTPAGWSDEWGRWQWKGGPYDGWNENIIAYKLETPDA